MNQAQNRQEKRMVIAMLVLLVIAIGGVGAINGHDLRECEQTHTKETCYAAFRP